MRVREANCDGCGMGVHHGVLTRTVADAQYPNLFVFQLDVVVLGIDDSRVCWRSLCLSSHSRPLVGDAETTVDVAAGQYRESPVSCDRAPLVGWRGIP